MKAFLFQDKYIIRRGLTGSLCRYVALVAGFIMCHYAAFAAAPESNADNTEKAETYTLRYRFAPGETLCWEVEHRGKITATVSGSTEETEMSSRSLKLWRVEEVKADGSATFVYSVDDADMSQKLPGNPEVTYNSRTDKKAPPGFEDVAKAVGKPLSKITIDARGKVLERKKMLESPFAENKGELTIPLPEKPVAVGQSWSEPHEIVLPLETGGSKRIQTMQKYTLASVKTGVGVIQVETQILTPVSDPAIEAKLIQHATRGKVRFDIEAGRIISQQTDLDKRVVGFRGASSSLHYLTRFSERHVDRDN